MMASPTGDAGQMPRSAVFLGFLVALLASLYHGIAPNCNTRLAAGDACMARNAPRYPGLHPACGQAACQGVGRGSAIGWTPALHRSSRERQGSAESGRPWRAPAAAGRPAVTISPSI